MGRLSSFILAAAGFFLLALVVFTFAKHAGIGNHLSFRAAVMTFVGLLCVFAATRGPSNVRNA